MVYTGLSRDPSLALAWRANIVIPRVVESGVILQYISK
jgi:hypothetical protein